MGLQPGFTARMDAGGGIPSLSNTAEGQEKETRQRHRRVNSARRTIQALQTPDDRSMGEKAPSKLQPTTRMRVRRGGGK